MQVGKRPLRLLNHVHFNPSAKSLITSRRRSLDDMNNKSVSFEASVPRTRPVVAKPDCHLENIRAGRASNPNVLPVRYTSRRREIEGSRRTTQATTCTSRSDPVCSFLRVRSSTLVTGSCMWRAVGLHFVTPAGLDWRELDMKRAFFHMQ